MGQMFAGSKPQTPPQQYQTQLNPIDKIAFDAWQTGYGVPHDPSPKSDYDMQGFYKGMMQGDPDAQQSFNKADGRMHFTDKWKTPYHKTFSNESMYAPPDAPKWVGDDKSGWKLIDKTGKVIADESQ